MKAIKNLTDGGKRLLLKRNVKVLWKNETVFYQSFTTETCIQIRNFIGMKF